MNSNLLSIRPHPSKQISDAIAHDPEAINLTVGEPSYGPPDLFLDTVAYLSGKSKDDSSFYNRYAHSRGVSALREAISRRYKKMYDLDLDSNSQVIITHGAAEAIWLSVFAVTNPGDEVIIPDPCYMLYEPIVLSLGRCPVRVRTSVEKGFLLNVDQIEQAITTRTRLILLNSPENPTGAVYHSDGLRAISDCAGRRGLYIMHDEVFDDIVFTGSHVPLCVFDPKTANTIMVNSFSKRFGMTGWRLGWLVAAPDVVALATKAHSFISLATGTLIQEAAAIILNDPEIEKGIRANTRKLFHRSRRFLNSLLAISGFKCSAAPLGGFYVFPEITDIYKEVVQATAGSGSMSEKVAQYLLDTCKVAVVPGTGFGPGGEGYVRISFAASDDKLEVALERFRTVLGKGARTE